MTYQPYQCLTVGLDGLEANVHFVRDGEVYYGVYRDGALLSLYRKTVAAWWDGVELAVQKGGALYSLLSGHDGDKHAEG